MSTKPKTARKATQPAATATTHAMNIATLGQRFAALWIDVFVLMPFFIGKIWLESISKTLVVLLAVAYCFYTIYCHGRFGRTIGKLVVGIRIMRTTGERIGWREAGCAVQLTFYSLPSALLHQLWHCPPLLTPNIMESAGCSEARMSTGFCPRGLAGPTQPAIFGSGVVRWLDVIQ